MLYTKIARKHGAISFAAVFDNMRVKQNTVCDTVHNKKNNITIIQKNCLNFHVHKTYGILRKDHNICKQCCFYSSTRT